MPSNNGPAFNNTPLAHPASALGDAWDFLTAPYRPTPAPIPPEGSQMGERTNDMNEISPGKYQDAGINLGCAQLRPRSAQDL